MFRLILIALLGFLLGMASGVALIIWQEDRLRKFAAQAARYLKVLTKEAK